MLTRPVMVLDSPGHTLADEADAGAAIVLYCGFSLLAQYCAVRDAVARFRQTGNADAIEGLRAEASGFEDFMGYAAFAERSRKCGPA